MVKINRSSFLALFLSAFVAVTTHGALADGKDDASLANALLGTMTQFDPATMPTNTQPPIDPKDMPKALPFVIPGLEAGASYTTQPGSKPTTQVLPPFPSPPCPKKEGGGKLPETYPPTGGPYPVPEYPTGGPLPAPVPPTGGPYPVPVPPTGGPYPVPEPPTGGPYPVPVPPTGGPYPVPKPPGGGDGSSGTGIVPPPRPKPCKKGTGTGTVDREYTPRLPNELPYTETLVIPKETPVMKPTDPLDFLGGGSSSGSSGGASAEPQQTVGNAMSQDVASLSDQQLAALLSQSMGSSSSASRIGSSLGLSQVNIVLAGAIAAMVLLF